MTYGHAERNLALIRQLEAETQQLLAQLAGLASDQHARLHDTEPGNARRPGQRPSYEPAFRSPA